MPICDKCGINWTIPPEYCPQCNMDNASNDGWKCNKCGEQNKAAFIACCKCGNLTVENINTQQPSSETVPSSNISAETVEVFDYVGVEISIIPTISPATMVQGEQSRSSMNPINQAATTINMEKQADISSDKFVLRTKEESFAGSLPKWDLLPPMMPIKRVKRNL